MSERPLVEQSSSAVVQAHSFEWDRVWRLKCRSILGEQDYVDVDCGRGYDGQLVAQATCRERYGVDRGWWVETWQLLMPYAGTDRPPLWFRVRWAWRRRRRVSC